MKRLKQYHSKVVFIQGTHLLVSEITKENMAKSAVFQHLLITCWGSSNTYLKQNQILDPTGRFIIIQSSLMNLTLVNLYGPPVFTTVCSFLLQLFVVTGSDSSHLKSRQVIRHFMSKLNLKDIWRLENILVVQPVTIAAVLQVTSLIRTLLSPELTVVLIRVLLSDYSINHT